MSEQVSSDWNLICGGPSRAHLRAEHLLEGATVSVNRALDVVEQGITVDHAAFADGPELLWKNLDLQRFWRPGMILWINSGCVSMNVTTKTGDKAVVPGAPYAKVWDTVLDSCIGFRLMPTGSVPDTENPTVTRGAFTTLCAFKCILRYQPKRVRILSMDLAGSWVDGLSEETCAEKEREVRNLDRWKHERATMTRHINQARGEGIVVEELIPEPLEEALDGSFVH
jgi:hypothetical protein